METDTDDAAFNIAVYEGGTWIWSELNQQLEYDIKLKSDLPPEVEMLTLSTKAPTGTIEFRDDIDLMEQLRFRRRYQRKLSEGEQDIITIQDIKDLSIYTAPINILSDSLIKILHLSTTERFLRALIFYCQYYLQIADEMGLRILELETKIRTPQCTVVEDLYRTNLMDLRVLVAKEYCTMTIGGDDMKRYHHMGPTKKRVSLSDKDARQTETLIRISVQIVWLALGRRSFNQIELEINRLFKTDIFNNVEHNLRTEYISKMTLEERSVLLGTCVRRDKKLNTKSPLVNAVFCHREIDYQMMGLGVIKCMDPNPRLVYMKLAIAGPEELYAENDVTVGILGLGRSTFDTMLRPIPISTEKNTKAVPSSQYLSGGSNRMSKKSIDSSRKSIPQVRLYPDIVLPPKEPVVYPPSFPDEPDIIKPCSAVQLKKWQNRFHRLTAQIGSIV